jgi:ASCH domain
VKAISIRQPWANMIASGEKTIETRTWSIPYRGELLIVSSKNPNIPPAGYALAIAELVTCRRMKKTDEEAARCRYYPGAFAWVLKNIRKIKSFPVSGQLGLYEVNINEARKWFLLEKSEQLELSNEGRSSMD